MEEVVKADISDSAISSKVKAFLSTPRKMLINGEWVSSVSGKTFTVYNPATGKELAKVYEGDKADIDLAVAAAREAFENGPWRTMSPMERSRIIWKIADLMYEHRDELSELESLDNGKSKGIANAVDIPLSADHFHYYAGWATKIEGQTFDVSIPLPPGARFTAFTKREPVGVVGLIAATTLQLGQATAERVPVLWPALVIFAGALAILYLWKSKLNIVAVIFAAGAAGWFAYG